MTVRKRPLAEKVAAVAAAYEALAAELPDNVFIGDEQVQAALIHAATAIGMGTETEDIGLLAPVRAPRGIEIETGPNPDPIEGSLKSADDLRQDIARLIWAAGGSIKVPDMTAVLRFNLTVAQDLHDPLNPSIIWTAKVIE